MSNGNSIRQGIYQSGLVRRVAQWLDAIPHPLIACEISTDYVAAARWNRTGVGLDGFSVEPLSPGAISPTAAESNLIDANEVRSAMGRVFSRLKVKNEEVALLVPDAVIRVFVLHFDVVSKKSGRSPTDPALAPEEERSVRGGRNGHLLYAPGAARRWRGHCDRPLARLRIVREYESLVESVGMSPGVVMSSTLAALPLLSDGRPSLLARIAGTTLDNGHRSRREYCADTVASRFLPTHGT